MDMRSSLFFPLRYIYGLLNEVGSFFFFFFEVFPDIIIEKYIKTKENTPH